MDEIDRAQMHIEAELAERFFAHREKAEQRLLFKSTGYCESCGSKINEMRLKVHPNAMRCVECQMDYEEGLKR